ncbi:EcsC family protein [Rhabdothermincola salaria]|uniref:EcsC family protein n=1 Tax=Rhabdothermincola salaria TaxID=2903142 RepID=UPI001E2FBFAB|nr:EcsC family protein [Rhabdothermincola salaria]
MDDSEETWDLSELSPYDRQAWQGIQRWQDAPSRRSLVPEKARRKAGQIGQGVAEAWKEIPGSAHIDEVVQMALTGGNEALTDAVAASLRRDRIIHAANSAGCPVEEIADLRSLDLQSVDTICPSLNIRYAAASAVTGAGSGFVAGGGTAAIMGTGGVAAAPGGLAVGGALAADVVATIALAARVVTHYAGYYGYDAREEEEKAVILAVIGVGVVGEGAAKQTAMLHVRQIAMMVARRAAWRELGEEVIVKLIQGLFAKLSVTLTKRKLAQALPVAGIAIGAGFNYALMRKVGTAASFAYRERFLIEKYGLDSGGPTPDLADVIDIEDFEDMPAIEDHTDESDMN